MLRNKVTLLLIATTLLYNYAIAQIIVTNKIITHNTNCNFKGKTYSGSPVVINEIMINPSGNGMDGSIYDDISRLPLGVTSYRGEWVELYNPDNSKGMDLSYCFLGNSYYEGTNHLGACFEFPIGTLIPPLGFAIVRGTNAPPVPFNQLVINGGNTIEIIVDENSIMNLEYFRLWLGNIVGWLAIYDKNGLPLDAASWGEVMHKNFAGHPSTPNYAGNSYFGELPSYDDIPNNKKCNFYSYNIVPGQSIRRIPDAGSWMMPADPTYGYCNDVCIPLPTEPCNGKAQITVANGTPPYTYQWDDITKSTTDSISNLCPGVYHVSITDITGTTIADSVIIENTLPLVNLGNDTTYCSSFSRTLNANNTGSTYLWSTREISQAINISKKGNYSVKVTTPSYCSASDTIKIKQSVKPNLGNDSTICEGQNLVLDAGDYKKYDWSNDSTSRTIRPKISGAYIVTVTDSSNCMIGDTTIITINPLPKLFLGNDTAYCESNYILNAGAGFSSYKWSNNGGNNQFIQPQTTDEYWVEVQDQNNCINKDTISISIYPLPIFDLGPDKLICEGDSITIDVGAAFQKYYWSTGNTEKSINAKISGVYTVTVTDNNQCSKNDSVEISFFPKSEIISIDTSINGQLTVKNSEINLPHEFSIDQKNYQSSNVFTHLNSGEYTINLKDKNLCVTSRSIKLYEDIITIPNYFTPNSDNYHDTWIIEGISAYPEVTIQIFDRFGKVVASYKGTDNDKGTDSIWDGTCNSVPLRSDDYWYVIDLHNGTKPFTGHVTIKR